MHLCSPHPTLHSIARPQGVCGAGGVRLVAGGGAGGRSLPRAQPLPAAYLCAARHPPPRLCRPARLISGLAAPAGAQRAGRHPAGRALGGALGRRAGGASKRRAMWPPLKFEGCRACPALAGPGSTIVGGSCAGSMPPRREGQFTVGRSGGARKPAPASGWAETGVKRDKPPRRPARPSLPWQAFLHAQDDGSSFQLRAAVAQLLGPHLRSLKLVSQGGGRATSAFLQCSGQLRELQVGAGRAGRADGQWAGGPRKARQGGWAGGPVEWGGWGRIGPPPCFLIPCLLLLCGWRH